MTPGSRPPAPFVVGLTRSGTTLLRMMLDAHRELTIPPETHFVPDLIKAARDGGDAPTRCSRRSPRTAPGATSGSTPRSCAAPRRGSSPATRGGAVRAFFDAYAERQGKPRWGDKTPAYMLADQRIGRALPEARFVHLIRDGRDVALSPDRAGAERAAAAAPSRPRAGSSGSRKSREQAAEAGGSPLRRGPLRGPRPRPRADAAADLRVRRARLGPGAC